MGITYRYLSCTQCRNTARIRDSSQNFDNFICPKCVRKNIAKREKRELAERGGNPPRK